MANIKEAFEYASQNPTSDFANNLKQLAGSGALDVEAQKYGIDLSPFKTASPATPKKEPTLIEKMTSSVTERGKNIQNEVDSAVKDIQSVDTRNPKDAFMTAIRPLRSALRVGGQLAGGVGDVVGEALASAIPDAVKEQGAKLLNTDAGRSAVEAISQGMEAYDAWKQKNPEIAKDFEATVNIGALVTGLRGAKIGFDGAVDATKAVASKVAPAVTPVRDFTVGMKDFVFDKTTGALKSVPNRVKGINPATLEETLADPAVHSFVAKSPENVKIVSEAVKQGFEPKDINFMSSIAEADKPVLKEMADLAEKAGKDIRVQKRPLDIVGDNGVATLRKIEDINKSAGAEVDKTARALAGEVVDTSNVSEKALSLLSDAGVVAKISPNGVTTLDFSKSIFAKTPAVQKVLSNALSDMPHLEADAYAVHKFKKSLDEVVQFGTAGEGLKGRAQGILKMIRTEADNALDSKFSAYNKANTDFKKTRELLDEAHNVIGKQTDFFTNQGSQDFGQAMRSLFSNNKSRGKLTSFLENLQKTAKEFGVASEHNLVDQALFSQILEEVYGTQAVTGLKGQVEGALRTAVDFKTNPIGAILKTGANVVDKTRNINPEQKKAILKKFLDIATE